MYFPVGWPKGINLPLNDTSEIRQICCDGVKILIGAISDNAIGIWYTKPLIPITYHKRSDESVEKYGKNSQLIWKPDSSKLAVITDKGCIIFYKVDVDLDATGILNQIDSPCVNLKRDSAELFIKEIIPRLFIKEMCNVSMDSIITSLSCISLSEIMIATQNCELIRLQWDELEYSSNIIDLRKITFYANQNSNNPKGVPLIGTKSYVRTMDYSPLIGGFAVVFNDYKAAFLTANSLKFEQNKVQGFWVPDLEDATCCSINHKYRLMAFGRKNSEAAIFSIEDTTGGLEFSHKLSLNCKIYPNSLGAVNELKWSPDGCAIAMAWKNGGISLWSTFGTMLMSSLSWDFGLHVDLPRNNPLVIYKMEWSTEGYQLFMLRKSRHDEVSINDQPVQNTNVLQMDFVKSTLTMNPCMTAHSHILLQGDNTIYLNQGNNLETVYCGSKCTFPNNQNEPIHSIEENFEIGKFTDISSILSESKYWTIVQLPLTYAATNWPIRYSAIDSKGIHIAVAGRTGLAHYSVLTKKWKLFGNETQEKDFVVTGGLLWWKDFIIMGCFSLLDRSDEIRSYPKENKLDNQFVSKMQVKAPVMLLNIYLNQLVALQADGMVNIFNLHRNNNSNILGMECMYEIDIRSICIHPACIVSLTVTNLKNDLGVKFAGHDSNVETIVLNVSGRILMVQRESKTNVIIPSMATCLASCVECFWQSNSENSHMKDCLWLYSGAHGMRVWLPILPPEEEIQNRHRRHTFMSKRIMLSFPLKLYPLVILFENVIFLGVENESTLYTSDFSSHFSLPFSFLEKKSQVYLHKILRQLIKRNLGYSAWEIAKSCRNLPYFPHSLELLLHEVLEEEATSKDPIPDALLPSILDFIREFPVYLQTIVQCARKTEIALWPYLFSIAGKPKELFQQCLEIEELETAASYLIILQNLEPSSISKQYATLLLDIALENKKWELAKDLIRFLKAIDPNEVDSPRSSFIVNNKIAPTPQPQVNSDPDVLNLILGPIARERSFSTPMAINMSKTNANISINKSKDNKNFNSTKDENAANLQRRKSERSISREKKEIFFIETILQRHARKLLENNKLLELGYMSAFLDIQLVSWISQENERAGKINDFVTTLIQVHEEFNLPTPILQTESDELSNNTLSYLSDHCRNTSSHTSESGYFSLPIGDKSDGVNNFGLTYSNSITCIKEDDEQSVVNFERFNSLPEGTSHYENRIAATFYHQGQQSEFLKKNLPEKLEVKIRYLLQLLIEANCIDYSLILSIILLDASSIVRIINFALRSDSISSCYRIQTALKKITHWSFQEKTNYRNFMMLLQPQLYILDQYIAQHNLNYVKENIMDNTELEMHSEKNSIPVSSTNLPKTSNNWSEIQNNSKALRKKSNSLDAVTQTRLIDNNSENEHIKNENGICIVM